MTLEEAEILHDYQSRFEADATTDNAYRLFRELNQHNMFLTVIRLYWKYEMDKESRELSFNQMQSQYEYARD